MSLDLYIVEDCVPLHGTQSVFIKEHVTRHAGDSFMVIGWKEPGWSGNKENVYSHELIDFSCFFPSAIPFKGQELTGITKIIPTRDEREREIEKALLMNTQNLEIQELISILYRGCRVGMGVASTILRHNQTTYQTGYVSFRIARELLLAATRGVDIMFALGGLFKLRSFYCSETVYQTIPLIDACLDLGGKCPLLLDPGFPCELNYSDKLYSYASGVSERILSSARAKASFYRKTKSNEAEVYKDRIRIRGKNSSSDGELFAAEVLYSTLSNQESVFIDNLDALRNHIGMGKTIFILHMHAVTDGPFFVGYSGFVSPFNFFLHFIRSLRDAYNKLGECNHKIHIVVKPHPNILAGSFSSYRSHREKACGEKRVSSYIFRTVIGAIRACGFPVSGISPMVGTCELLTLDKTLHVTHHGAISLEAAMMSRFVIATRISPAALLRDNRNVLFLSGDDDNTKLASFLKVFWEKASGSEEEVLKSENSRYYAVGDRYYGEYRSAVKRLYAVAEKEFRADLDTVIIRSGLSFKSINELPKYLIKSFSDVDLYQPGF